tara:strand:- start:233 stop:379 length:147 start_codon:yes stop_codon:yes gene_type:complete
MSELEEWEEWMFKVQQEVNYKGHDGWNMEYWKEELKKCKKKIKELNKK